MIFRQQKQIALHMKWMLKKRIDYNCGNAGKRKKQKHEKSEKHIEHHI